MAIDIDKKDRPYRPHRRKNGRDTPIKRPDAGENATPKTVYLFHGLGSSFLRDGRPDMRSSVGKALCDREMALSAHVGDPTAPAARLIRHASRYSILADALWTRINTDADNLPPEMLAGLLEIFVKINREERETLKTLGLQRPEKPVQDLQTFLREKAADKP